jgi:hypothetical protein
MPGMNQYAARVLDGPFAETKELITGSRPVRANPEAGEQEERPCMQPAGQR